MNRIDNLKTRRFDKIAEKSKPHFSEIDRTSIFNTALKLKGNQTSADRPGILFGHIQSGKTRNYTEVIACDLDEGSDYIVVLTKSTKLSEKQIALEELCIIP